jgi:hypothetical protein
VRHFASIRDFQAFARTELPALLAEGKQAGLRQAARIIGNEMRGEIGEYQHGDAGFDDMAELAPGTLHGFGPVPGKIALGQATEANHRPLEATGQMRSSIGETVGIDAAAIGTDDPVAVYQNQGTDSRGVPYRKGETTAPGVPGREFVGRAGFRAAPDAVAAIRAAIIKAIT